MKNKYIKSKAVERKKTSRRFLHPEFNPSKALSTESPFIHSFPGVNDILKRGKDARSGQ